MPDPDPGLVDWKDLLGFVLAVLLTAALAWGLIAFIRHGWSALPLWLALVLCIVLSVAVIGTPIYTLWRWSERYLVRAARHRSR